MRNDYRLFYREISTGIVFQAKRKTPNDFSLIHPLTSEEINLSLHALRKRFISERVNRSVKVDPVRKCKSFFFYEK